MNARRLPGRILALSPGDLRDGRTADLVQRARAAVAAGLDSILLREPGLADRATLELARELRAVLGPGGWLGLHDRVHLAGVARADGVHLGFRSLQVAAARPLLGDGVALGYSGHAHDDPAAWAGADHVLAGPVFDTESKRGLLAPIGIDAFRALVRAAPVPVWGLGGIGPGNAHLLLGTGCRGIAVRGALLAAADPAAAFERLREACG